MALLLIIIGIVKWPNAKGKCCWSTAPTYFVRKGRNQNTLEVEHVSALLAAYEEFGTIAGRAHVVSIEEITAQGGNLNLAGYIAKVGDEVIPSVAESTVSLRAALEATWEAEDRLNVLLADRGLG